MIRCSMAASPPPCQSAAWRCCNARARSEHCRHVAPAQQELSRARASFDDVAQRATLPCVRPTGIGTGISFSPARPIDTRNPLEGESYFVRCFRLRVGVQMGNVDATGNSRNVRTPMDTGGSHVFLGLAGGEWRRIESWANRSPPDSLVTGNKTEKLRVPLRILSAMLPLCL
jgi:hypothetical protein